MSILDGTVIAVKPESITIAVKKINDLEEVENKLRVGSFLEIDNDDHSSTLATIKSFSIGAVHEDDIDKVAAIAHTEDKSKRYILEAFPLGIIDDNGVFKKGCDAIPIPPRGVRIADPCKIKSIYEFDDNSVKSLCFSELHHQTEINVHIDGDKFFGKHFSILGSTGSGKSHTTAKILQEAISFGDKSPNNAHIVLFDIHSEYKTAFPKANYIDASSLNLPYWLLNSEEMEELFLDSGDNNNYNQQSLLRKIITENKRECSLLGDDSVVYDTPIYYDILSILNCLDNLRRETVSSKNSLFSQIESTPEEYKTFDDKIRGLSKEKYSFAPGRRETASAYGIKAGPYADGTIDKFYYRLQSKITDERLKFIFGEEQKNTTLEDVIKSITGYNGKNNVSIIDLSGVPFEVLSITVSLISRLLFDFGYIRKKHLGKTDIPLLVVYEEAHKYVPKSDLVKYKSVRNSIERIAKEGRKYGVSLCIVSQRPSEISETIFSQCNNFVIMRLSNPNDQSYVKRLLPDSSSDLVGSLSSLGSGEALLIGDAIVMPTLVNIKRCSHKPSSSDIKYLSEWEKSWVDPDFPQLISLFEEMN